MTQGFENLVLELYDKHKSKEYMVNNRYTFYGSITMFNTGFSFTQLTRENLEKNKDDFESLWIEAKDFERQIQRSQYVSHEYLDDNTLKIKTRNRDYDIKLK